MEVESIFKELCLGLNPRDLSHATQECSANVLCDVWQAHFSSMRYAPPYELLFLGH